MTRNGTFRTAILFLAISAVLHILAPIVSGFAADGLRLAAVTPIFLVMIWGLWQEWRWFAYICFFLACIGGIIALGFIWSVNPVPAWIYASILAADWIAAAALFAALWRSRPVAEV